MATLTTSKCLDPVVFSWIGTALAVGYAAYVTYANKKSSSCCSSSQHNMVNQNIKKDEAKVVDSFDVEDMGNKEVFCRCWRSKKFPYCDGAHAKHNKETGDNVGPLIVQKRSSAEKQ